MKEPTHALLRIELEKWKPLLRSLCEVRVPVEGGSVSYTVKLLSGEMGHILTWHCLGHTPFAIVGAVLIFNRGEILVLLISREKF